MSSRPQSQRDPDQERDEVAVREFVEHFGLVLNSSGMPRMAARVFAALLATDHATLTAGEMAESLQISPAAVSGAVRYLSQVGMIQRGRKPGERRDHYYLGDDFWYEAVGARNPIYQRLGDSLNEGMVAVGVNTEAGKRIADTRDFFHYLADQLPVLVEQWRKDRATRDA